MMFNHFLNTVTREMLTYLVKHPERNASMDAIRIPALFKPYLADVSEEALMSDVALVVAYAGGRKDLDLASSEFFKTLVAFFTGPFASKLDMLSADYYTFSETDQKTVVDALIKTDTPVSRSIKHLLLHYTYQELASAIHELCVQVAGSPTLVVQSPRDMDSKLKKEIRKELLEQHPLSFPRFQINKKLIGGLRLFKDGETLDYSWLSRVYRFTSLTSA